MVKRPQVEGLLMAEKQKRGVPIAVRVPPEMVKRLDRLLPKVSKDRAISTFGQVTRSSVVKLALLRGIETLENEYK